MVATSHVLHNEQMSMAYRLKATELAAQLETNGW
jgi:hypothetical protein